jgi:septum formation protein
MIRLGSKSPSRAQILKENNIDFIQSGGNFDEECIKTTNPFLFVKEATLGKFEELYNTFGINELPLLVADSVVVCNNQLLRKPKNKVDAYNMLDLQSNNYTSIVTCMIYKSKDTYLINTSKTTYFFDKFKEDDLAEYINSELCMGKAGAIMVEGFCKKYIKEINGFESTAKGLCIEKLKPFLKNS